MKALHYSCQGESHKATNKVCQDYSYSEINDRLAIAIVCDGHGGKRYFRSDVGAKYATEITKECVTTFIEGVGDELFKGTAFTQVYALNTEIKNDNFAKKTKVDVAMRQLFSAIIYRWREKILEHAKANPLSDAERSSLDPRYVTDFENKVSLEKTYGCTLMCYAQTPDYWLAFHVGDGKCIAFDHEGNWSEPIPWDERCFLNKTTSLCDSEALDEFRYCYQGNGEFPAIVFLGSDGIDDSFGETTNMVNFYAQVAKMLAKEPFEDCINSIQTTLPELSARGSQDDMSVACVYDEVLLGVVSKSITEWQQRNVLETIRKLNERIVKFSDEYEQYAKRGNLSDKEKIDKQNTLNALKRAFEFKREQAKRYNRFAQELYGDEYEPFADDIGLAEMKILEAVASSDLSPEETGQSVIAPEQEVKSEDTQLQGVTEPNTTEADVVTQQEVAMENDDVDSETSPEMEAAVAVVDETGDEVKNNVQNEAEQLDSSVTEAKTDSEDEQQ